MIQNIGSMLFLRKKAPARNAPVVVRARSSENRRMFLPSIEETPRSTLWKQILMKWVCHKGKTKNRFYHENFDPTCKYHCKSTFLLKTLKRVLFRPVILYRAVWSKHERGVRFQIKNPDNLRCCFLQKIYDFQVLDENSVQFQRWNDG